MIRTVLRFPPSNMARHRSKRGRGKRAFNPEDDTNIEHRSIGVWDFYVQRDPRLSWIPRSWKIEEYAEILNDVPYLWRTVKDIAPDCWKLLVVYMTLTLVLAFIPAISLW